MMLKVHPKGIRLLVGKRLQQEILIDDLVMPDVDPAVVHIQHASIQDPYLLVHLSDRTVGLFLASSPGQLCTKHSEPRLLVDRACLKVQCIMDCIMF